MARLGLEIGASVDAGAPFLLDGSRLNRHTFWCGQSGSGKTYALGVLLERVLRGTGLPVVIFDPNSDFVELGTTEASAPAETAALWDTLDVRVLRPGSETSPLLVRFAEMPFASRAAVLRLDPIRDSEEYGALRDLDNEYGGQDAAAFMQTLAATQDPARQRLLARLRNLGILEWTSWARGAEGAEQVVQQRPDATVIDLGGFHDAEEPAAVALAILDRLWEQRSSRRPALLVIDEAHNLCPPDPSTPVQKALVERLIRIAAEGRKFGLWLLLSTQRPGKVHPQVLSQCDNLCLMRLNGEADVAQLATFFSAVPRATLDRAVTFAQGQAVFAGPFAGEPTVVQMADRWTRQGGSDVAVPLTRDLPSSPSPE